MRHNYTLDKYTSSNCELTLSPLRATSWKWWCFLTQDKAGNIIFNDYSYSVSTGKHQRDVWNILSRLSIRVHLTLEYTTRSLDDIEWSVKDEIRILENKIESLVYDISRKGTHSRVNAGRVEDVKRYTYRIKDLKRYLTDYMDKKLLPLKPEHIEHLDGYTKFFTSKGKLNTHAFSIFKNRMVRSYAHPIGGRLFKLEQFLNTKDYTEILLYHYSSDINRMLPEPDTEYWVKLVKWAKKWIKTPLTTACLDRLHTKLVTDMNREHYSPRVPIAFNIHPTLKAIEHEDINIIETDKELRREGKEQHHCIGGRHYLDRCTEGYQALRFKGYTFFLSPNLEIVQTNGRYNAQTPENVKKELKFLIEHADKEYRCERRIV